MSELVIIISGPPDSGKRIVAGLIEDALRTAKITVRFEENNRNAQPRPSVNELQAALLRFGPVVTIMERVGVPVFPNVVPVIGPPGTQQPYPPMEPNPYSNPFIAVKNWLRMRRR